MAKILSTIVYTRGYIREASKVNFDRNSELRISTNTMQSPSTYNSDTGFFEQEQIDYPEIWADYATTEEFGHYQLVQVAKNNSLLQEQYRASLEKLHESWDLHKIFKLSMQEMESGRPFIGPDTPRELGEILNSTGDDIFPGENTPHFYHTEEGELEFPVEEEGRVVTVRKVTFVKADWRNHIVYGRWQEGKTTASFILSVNMARKTKSPLLWITQNHENDISQLIKNMRITMVQMGMVPLPIMVIDTTRTSIREFIEAMRHDRPMIFVTMGNQTRIKKIVDEIIRSEIRVKMILDVDEADIYFCANRVSNVSLALRTLIDMSMARFMISATFLDAIASFGPDPKIACHIVTPRPGYTYRGIEEIRLDPIDIDGDSQDIVVRSLRKIERTRVSQHREAGVATIVLGIVSVKNDDANSLCAHIRRNTTGWATIEFNNSTKKSDERAKVKYCRENGTLHAVKFEEISMAISYCVNHNKMKIFITGGMLFNRGCNFVSDDYAHNPTDMIYTMNPSSAPNSESHRLARFFGIDKTVVDRVLHTSEKIYKRILDIYYSNCNFAERLKDHPDMTMMENAHLTVVPKRFGKHKLSKRQVESNFIKTREHPVVNLLPEQAEDRVEETDDELSDREFEYESTREQLEEMKKSYNRGGNVKKIIDLFVEEGFRSLSKEEIRQACTNQKFAAHAYTKWDFTRHRYYNIVEKAGANYILRAEIKEYLNL